jgi:DNA-binding CsgD family transcriptional regulator
MRQGGVFMKRLSPRRLEKVLEFLQATYRAQDLDEFASLVPSAITRVIEADLSTYSEVNPVRKRVGWHHEPVCTPLLKFRRIFERFMHDDPLVNWYANGADGRAVKISDLMTQRQFHALPIYNEFYRRLALEHQIAFLLDTVKPLLVGVTLNRSTTDFNEDDRLTLNVLRPHLIQAYRNASAITESQRQITLMMQGIEDVGRAIILVSREGAILRTTTKSRRWLACYFGWPGRGSARCLPETLDRWLRQELRRRSAVDAVAPPAEPFFIEHDAGGVIVRALVQDDRVLLLLDHHPPATAHAPRSLRALQSLGLSPRESEVLAWVAQGKTNPEIGTILGLSGRTIQTHLDHIYRKLDVQTRTAAVAKAMEARCP